MDKKKKGTKPPFFKNNPQGQTTSREPKMIETRSQRPRQPPIQCWGCKGDHMFIYYPHRGEKLRTIHNLQQAEIVEDMGRNVTRIYASLDNKQTKYQSHMIEVEGMNNNQTISILIESGASHIYIYPKMLEGFHFPRSKDGKSWLVQLATRAKRRVNDMVKSCLMDMNRMKTRVDLKIFHLGSYDCIIGMDWLDQHHDILDCHNKEFTCLDEEGSLRKV
jgi:hypothetical protein